MQTKEQKRQKAIFRAEHYYNSIQRRAQFYERFPTIGSCLSLFHGKVKEGGY